MDSKELQNFMENLYDEGENSLNDTYRQKKESRDELLKAIAIIMLSYNIVDGVMSLSDKDFSKESNNIKKLIKSLTMADIVQIRDNTSNILKNTVESVFDFYSYNYNLEDVKKIIDSNFKGKHFSDRIWSNEQEVANRLYKQCQDFLHGKINVNQIKKDIEKTYNTSAYNAKRLAETEISRVQNKSFLRFCEETGVLKLRYNAILDVNTCSDCAKYDGNIYDFGKQPDLPRHPQCKCFYVQEDDEKHLVMNLQLFAKKSNWEILRSQINSGILDENEAKNGMKYWEKAIKKEIVTPIEVINKSRKSIDQYWHILEDHKEFLNPSNIDEIVESLKNPDEIRLSFGKNVYIKNIKGKDLIVIVNSDIITAYYPNKRYLNNIKKKVLLWRK